MQSLAPGRVFDLLSTGGSRGADDDLWFRSPDGRSQGEFGYFERQIVMFALVPEGTGHPATARINLVDHGSGDHPHQISRALGPEIGLLLAVTVEEDIPPERLKGQWGDTPSVDFIHNERLDWERHLGYVARFITRVEI